MQINATAVKWHYFKPNHKIPFHQVVQPDANSLGGKISCVQNCKLPLKYFDAVHLLGGAQTSKWVASSQIMQCCFATFFGPPLLLLS